MSDLISREKAVAELYKLSDNLMKAGRHQMALGVNDSIVLVGELMPTEAERKHGHWISVGKVDADGNQYHICSECRCGEMHVPIIEVRFCWNCGARMDGEKNE